MLAPCALEQVITDGERDAGEGEDRLRGSERPDDARRPTRSSRTRACSSSRTSSPTRAAWSSPTSSGCRASRSTSGSEDEVNAKLHDIVARAFNETWQTQRAPRHEPAHGRVRTGGPASRRGDDDARPVPVARRSRRPLRRAGRLPPLRAARSSVVRRRRRPSSSFELEEVDIAGDPELEAGTASSSPWWRSTASVRSRTSSSRKSSRDALAESAA